MSDLIPDDDHFESQQLVLSDLINRVLDKGVVITAHMTIAIADVDLIQLDLRLLISSVATLSERGTAKAKRGDVPVRPRPR
jgi:hypothetical protein